MSFVGWWRRQFGQGRAALSPGPEDSQPSRSAEQVDGPPTSWHAQNGLEYTEDAAARRGSDLSASADLTQDCRDSGADATSSDRIRGQHAREVEPQRSAAERYSSTASPSQDMLSASFIVSKVSEHRALEKEFPAVASYQEIVDSALGIEGAMGFAIVDGKSGMAMATGGSPGFDLDVAAAGNSSVVQAKLRTMAELRIDDGGIEDILITLSKQYHIIRTTEADPNVFMYLVLGRARSNLAMARYQLAKLESKLRL